MRQADLVLHCGANKVSRDQLAAVETPRPSGRWYPVPHDEVLGTVQRKIESSGLRVVNEAHSITAGGDRYFGLLQVVNGQQANDYATVIGIRNSHDKSFSAGLVVGSQVFVCDNLAFSGEVKIARKHTRYIRRDMPAMVARAVGRLGDLRQTMNTRIEAYKGQELDDLHAHDLIIKGLEARVIASSKLPAVLKEWREPSHEEFAERRNAWRLFNGFTEVLRGGNLHTLPSRTQALHGVFDSACGLLN